MVDYIIKRVFHVCNNNVWNTMYMEIGCCISRILLKSFGCFPRLFRMRGLHPFPPHPVYFPCPRVAMYWNDIKFFLQKSSSDIVRKDYKFSVVIYA